MRFAVISDVHSNLEALRTALQVIEKEGVEEVVCLGDVVGYGAEPNECLALVREKCSVILKGNHDEAVADTVHTENFSRLARTAALWTHEQLTEENKEFLRTLPFTTHRDPVMFVHASPCNPERWDYIVSPEEAVATFRCFEEWVCFNGHTHVPGVFSEMGKVKTVGRAGRHLVNVGSVGQPRDGNPRLSLGIFDTEEWTYKNIRAKYDLESAAKKIRGVGLPAQLADRLLAGI